MLEAVFAALFEGFELEVDRESFTCVPAAEVDAVDDNFEARLESERSVVCERHGSGLRLVNRLEGDVVFEEAEVHELERLLRDFACAGVETLDLPLRGHDRT